MYQNESASRTPIRSAWPYPGNATNSPVQGHPLRTGFKSTNPAASAVASRKLTFEKRSRACGIKSNAPTQTSSAANTKYTSDTIPAGTPNSSASCPSVVLGPTIFSDPRTTQRTPAARMARRDKGLVNPELPPLPSAHAHWHPQPIGGSAMCSDPHRTRLQSQGVRSRQYRRSRGRTAHHQPASHAG